MAVLNTYTPRLSLIVVLIGLLCSSVPAAGQNTSSPTLARADSLRKAGDSDRAAALYREAQQRENDVAAAHIGLARLALDRQEWMEAKEHLDRAVERDDDNLEARYLRGIAFREQAKFTTMRTRLMQFFRRGAEDLSFVQNRNALYEDVLFQLALLRSYQKKHTEAINLAHTQVEMKPNLHDAHAGLFTIYRRFLKLAGPDDALQWLRSHPSEYGRYFRGEALRRDGQREQADNIFEAMLSSDLSMPRAPIFLSRARIYYTRDQPETAEAFVAQAIASIEDRTDALLVFDDFKYVLDPDEHRRYQSLEEPEEYRQFFRTLWEKRDPIPAQTVNVRLTEHYRRLRKAEQDFPYYGFRAWYNNPDASKELSMPGTYSLNTEFDDRGLVYIRHGQPDGWARTSDDVSWQYDNPRLDFHFSVPSTGGVSGVGNMRLVPIPSGEMLQRVAGWDADYSGMLKDAWLARDDVVEKSQAFIRRGLTTDSHNWAEDIEPFSLPHTLATFRGEDGTTRLEIHYALPVGYFTRQAQQQDSRIQVETGVALHDSAWNSLGTDTNIDHVPASQDPTAAMVDRFTLTMPPDSYHIAFHSRVPDAGLLAAHRTGLRVPDYSSDELNMSDVLPAFQIRPSSSQNRYTRNGLHVEPNPVGRFAIDAPVHLYFEIYNLTFGEGDQTQYTLTYTLTPQEVKRNLLERLFGGGPDDGVALSLEATRQGGEMSPTEYAELDVSNVRPGVYTLTVEVADQNTGQTVSRSQRIELSE